VALASPKMVSASLFFFFLFCFIQKSFFTCACLVELFNWRSHHKSLPKEGKRRAREEAHPEKEPGVEAPRGGAVKSYEAHHGKEEPRERVCKRCQHGKTRWVDIAHE
jgi:hypothetical protein